MSKEEIKVPENISTELVNTVKQLIRVRAEVEAVKKVVHPIKERILKRENFKVARASSGKYVESIKDDYKMAEDDVLKYCKLYHDEYIVYGFKVEVNYCPLLIVESKERKLGQKMVKLGLKELIGVKDKKIESVFYDIDIYRKFTKLIFDFVVGFEKL